MKVLYLKGKFYLLEHDLAFGWGCVEITSEAYDTLICLDLENVRSFNKELREANLVDKYGNFKEEEN